MSNRNPFFPYRAYYLILIVCTMLTACGVDRNIKKGEKYLQLGEYYDAATEFKAAYQRIPPKDRELRGQVAAKMALCYDHIHSAQRAIAAYRNQIRYNQANGETHLKLADNLMANANYADALKEYQEALDSIPNSQLAQEGIKAAQAAPALKQAGSRYTVKKMDVFNSRRADYSPMLFGDQFDQLYFTSTRNEAQGDELSGITGAKPETSSSVRKTTRANGVVHKLFRLVSTRRWTRVHLLSRQTDARCTSPNVL